MSGDEVSSLWSFLFLISMVDSVADEDGPFLDIASPIVNSTSPLLLSLHPVASILSCSRPTQVTPRWDMIFSMRVRGSIPRAFG